MQLKYLTIAGLAPGLSCALSKRTIECSFTTDVSKGDTCDSFADGLQQLNPGITCPDLDTTKSYCVNGTVSDDAPSTMSTTTMSATTTAKSSVPTPTTITTTTAAVPTNSPAMPGIVDNCDEFYKVSFGDHCDTIAETCWNSEINDSCSNLWLDYYICLHGPGSTATTPETPEPTEDPGSSPTPQMPGIVEHCDEYYKVASGDKCEAISKSYDISTAQFKSWNTKVNDDCSNLWLDYYVCVHIPGTTTTTTAAPDPTNDPSSPMPQLPGIVENCNSFHLIKDGENCWSISNEAGITLAQLHEWNTELNAACDNLWLGYYVCIGV
ncbi:LysM domain-containing protein [Aspergillus eucalypticola CBS 122712]|uniref:LysM domain-containing protein n=1 Tax=Aspergillus eucalypticola (strain CBS 122712 / IBT 29274) TaxID=1448314 RepID=A0A317W841_ASPEC|nr:LysM domain-containing protein [Aspergillus eucalypticola CBS 122712]PWY82543.1 LysM domain-containing protein [Aspergillus eucalypticola CBS 122712]